MSPDEVRRYAAGASAIRAGFGALAVASPGPVAGILGFPREQVSEGAVLMSRLFGVRELALAAIVLGSLGDEDRLRRVFALNAAVDAGDAAALVGSVASGEGGRRAALSMAVPALVGCGIWLRLLGASSDRT